MKQDTVTRANNELRVLGIDLAKHSFQLHGIDEAGRLVLKKKPSRRKLTAFIVNLPPFLIGLKPVAERTTGYMFYINGAYGTHNGASIRQTLRQIQQK